MPVSTGFLFAKNIESDNLGTGENYIGTKEMKSHINPNISLESKVFILHLIKYFENYEMTPICLRKLYRLVIGLQQETLQNLISYEFVGVGTTSRRDSAMFDKNIKLSLLTRPENYLFITHNDEKKLEMKQLLNQSIQIF